MSSPDRTGSDGDQKTPPPKPDPVSGEEKDAPLRDIILYALGNIESAVSSIPSLLNNILIVALGMNPLVMGFVLSIKTLWDAVTDPVMAQISDNARTPWGRRRPFILVGGVSRILFLVVFVVFFPRDPSVKSNRELAEAHTSAAAATAVAPATAGGEADEEIAESEAVAAPAKPAPPPKPSTPASRPGFLETLTGGFREFVSSENAYHRTVAIYVLIGILIFTTLGALQSVPYFALGIELCPSYDGRTRVVTYRAIMDKIIGVFVPWILPFCFLPVFFNVFDGMIWFVIIVAAFGLPTTIAMCVFIRERAQVETSRKKGPGIFTSIAQTASNIHFLKILFLYQFISITNGVFAQFGFFLNVYWIYKGDALAGSTMGGYVGTLGVAIAFVALPVVNWACRKFQKHRALRYAIIWMTLGTAAKWVLFSPDHPYLQLALPFFFSVGISAVFTVLPTMMADVTDIDELRHGVRREGMFGAVMGFLMKVTFTLQPIIAASILVLSGFDIALGAEQSPQTILNMRLMFSLVPASLLGIALVVLIRYPLTREYMENVKAQLVTQRATAASPPTA